jgi:hypothetical protein
MFLLCLIAALAGSPLRQAEAAGDLARSLAELDGGDVIEELDGGVGDDAGETVLNAGVRIGVDPSMDVPAIDHFPGPSPVSAACPAPRGDETGPPRPSARLAADPARRYAWLQAYRF